MTANREIYVKLLGEAGDVWRPVQAELLRDGIYLIVDQPYDRVDETWQFAPGSRVICNQVDSSDGTMLAACGLCPD